MSNSSESESCLNDYLNELKTTPRVVKKKKKKLFVIDPNFFTKHSHISPDKIRALSIRNAKKNPTPFKLNLGPGNDPPEPLIFADDVPYIFRLSEKVRVKIFQYIPSFERTRNLQLVCRLFRNEIRIRVGVQCFLHEDSRNGLSFMRDIIVDTVIVGKYIEPYMSPKNLIFHPRNVKELIFTSPISIQHMDAFLQRCSKIKKLSIRSYMVNTLASATLTKDVHIGFEWRALETIMKFPSQLRYLRDLTIDITGPDRAIKALPQIFNILYPKYLQRLAVKIGGSVQMAQTTIIHLKVISFIQHITYLTHILISTDQNDLFDWNEHEYLGFPRNNVMALSKSIQLHELILAETSVAFHTWCLIMLSQLKLEVFQVLHLMLWNIPEQVILNNVATLRKVAIHVILWTTPREHVPLDLKIFRKCISLIELYICTGAPISPGHSDLVNFNKLPSSLQTLLLKGCTFHTNDFMKIIKILPNLHTIGVLAKCGWTHYGIVSGSIRKLLRIRQLNELFISYYEIRDVKGMWTSRNKVNRALKKLGAIVNGNNQSTIHLYPKENCRWFKEKEDGEYACSLQTNWGH